MFSIDCANYICTWWKEGLDQEEQFMWELFSLCASWSSALLFSPRSTFSFTLPTMKWSRKSHPHRGQRKKNPATPDFRWQKKYFMKVLLNSIHICSPISACITSRKQTIFRSFIPNSYYDLPGLKTFHIVQSLMRLCESLRLCVNISRQDAKTHSSFIGPPQTAGYSFLNFSKWKSLRIILNRSYTIFPHR